MRKIVHVALIISLAFGAGVIAQVFQPNITSLAKALHAEPLKPCG